MNGFHTIIYVIMFYVILTYVMNVMSGGMVSQFS
jgi:hypothetical protein